MAGGKSWNEVRGQRTLNEARVATYRRLMDAQSEIAELLLGRGLVAEGQLDAALAASQAEGSDAAEDRAADQAVEEAMYLSGLMRYVSTLGGHIEITAVFPEASVKLRDLPEGDGRAPDESRAGTEGS